MSEIRFNIKKIPNIPIYISQGVTYFDRYELQYLGGPFPFYNPDDQTDLLWDASAAIRDSFLISPSETAPYIYLERIDDTTNSLLSGVYIEQSTPTELDPIIHTYYGLYILAEDTALLPATNKLIYNIKFKRLSDDWIIKIQEGICTVDRDIVDII
jgi:hypothetical protein